MLSLKEAAEAVGMTKPALFKAIKSGRLSANKDGKGQYQIDPAELFRVYPPQTDPVTHHPETLQLEIESLRREIRQKDAHLNDIRAQVDDLKADRDHWREQAERMTLLLTHQPPAAAANTNDTLKPPPSFLRRLFGNR
ncbi:MAG: hypothetical protein WAU60_02630 [Candidatus Competibacter denitrificans]